jgi:glycosyltransferase involved in cell wall biosynthesis
MPKRRLLVANYDYQPSTSVGGMRWLTMKKYLERLEYEIIVLTTDAFGRLPSDDDEAVVRARDLVASPRLRRVFDRPALPRPGQEVPVDTAPAALLTSVVVPDIYAVSWVPSAVRAMRRIIRERHIDAFVSTSPKDSTHLVGLAMPRSRRPAWIADFRDGWVFESTRPPLPTRFQRALDRRLEALVVQRADAVVAFSDVLARDFKRRLGRDTCCISNGWDPELGRDEPPHGEPVVPQRRRPIRLVYTGTLTGAVGAPTDRTPVPLLEALELVAIRHPELAERLELVVLGKRTDRDEAILGRFAHLGAVSHLGHTPRSTSLAMQRSADVLVLVTGTTPSSIPLKLFEYLGARRPILHLGDDGEADRILLETGTGMTVSPQDPDGLVEQLCRIARSEFGAEFAPREIERYSYPHVAEQMAGVIEDAIARNASRR